MNARPDLSQRTARTGIAVLAAALLVSGAAWRGFAAGPQSATAHVAPATTTTPITRAVAGGRDSYADIVNLAAPAVVTVRVSGKAKVSPTDMQGDPEDFMRRFFGDQIPFGQRQGPRPQMRTPRQRGLGSGVIVTTDGYLLTNYHVVDGADDIKVDLTDDRTLTAKLVGSDKASDLAVLKVTGSDFKALPLGNSDNVQVGDVVLAVGNPMGIGQTVTMGIISAKGRSTGPGDGSYEDFLQTDAPINHGNSGGALVNMKGELVGINSQILSNTDGNIGIGFAIPVNMAKSVMDQIRTKGKVTRAQLGVTVQQVTSDIAQNLGLKHTGGAIVSSVAPGSAAERAGVKQGDVIEAFNGQQVHDFNTLRNRVAAAGPGSTADLTIVRDGVEKHLSVKLDEANPENVARRGDGEPDSTDKAALGVSVAPITPELASRLGTNGAQGLVVENVDPDSRAAEAGIQAGDVIESVNRQSVKTVEDLRGAVKRAADKPVLLLINRQGSSIFVTVKPANG
ncbi:MAG TPA: DegQ family serine endoprotease [Vicinamibacterales bacterium]|nr:DegQ family serine endoprotease [Vicinamibacterales bacterium]